MDVLAVYSTHCAWILCKSKSNLISKSLTNIYDNINAFHHFLLQVFNITTYLLTAASI